MNPAAHIDAERLLKTEMERAQALAYLAKRNPFIFSWQYLVSAVVGAAWGWFTATLVPQGQIIVAAAAGAGFFLAVAAYGQAVAARRRVDALLVLTKVDGGR